MDNKEIFTSVALKLKTESRAEREWILKRLNVDVSAQIRRELEIIEKLGLENPENQSVNKKLKAKSSRCLNLVRFRPLLESCSNVEIILLCQSLSLLERAELLSWLPKKRRKIVLKTESLTTNRISKKFATLVAAYLLDKQVVGEVA
jgi:hypothetical protein